MKMLLKAILVMIPLLQLKNFLNLSKILLFINDSE